MAEDYPLEELEPEMRRLIDEEGAAVYQKWTCDACGERVTAGTPNQLTTHGRHDECPVQDGYITDLRVKGGNYMVIRMHVPEGLPYDGESQRGPI